MDASRRGDTTARNMLLAPENQRKILWISPNGQRNAQGLIDTRCSSRNISATRQSTSTRAPAHRRHLEMQQSTRWMRRHCRTGIRVWTEPLSFIPPKWIDALRPSTILQGGRDASYAGARSQLAPLLIQREGSAGFSSFLIDAIRSEAAARGAAQQIEGDQARALSGLLIAGPGSETARLRGNFSTMPALSGTAR